jgi:hypothetical protein
VRGLLLPIFLALVFLTATALLIRWLRDAVERILLAKGSSCCVESARLLRTLESSPGQLPTAWDRIELHLLQALPDCPPDYKIELVNAIDSAARACSHRDTAKRMLTLRNSLIA